MSTPIAKTSKSAKKSRIVKLSLSPDVLARFPHDSSPSKPAASIKPDPSPSIPPPSLADKTSESNATPVPAASNEDGDGNTLAPPKVDGRRRRGGAAGGTSGRKRAPPSIDPNAPPRERGRPGPKKKPRLPDGTIDHSASTTKPSGTNGNGTTTTTTAAHKLGPKANTGAINEKLRALDRSGKPCRRWERKGLQLKSFTGTLWNMPSWRAPEFAGDVKSDSTGGSSDVKESSAVASERSNGGSGENGIGGGDAMVVSSPAPAAVGA